MIYCITIITFITIYLLLLLQRTTRYYFFRYYQFVFNIIPYIQNSSSCIPIFRIASNHIITRHMCFNYPQPPVNLVSDNALIRDLIFFVPNLMMYCIPIRHYCTLAYNISLFSSCNCYYI